MAFLHHPFDYCMGKGRTGSVDIGRSARKLARTRVEKGILTADPGHADGLGMDAKVE